MILDEQEGNEWMNKSYWKFRVVSDYTLIMSLVGQIFLESVYRSERLTVSCSSALIKSITPLRSVCRKLSLLSECFFCSLKLDRWCRDAALELGSATVVLGTLISPMKWSASVVGLWSSCKVFNWISSNASVTLNLETYCSSTWAMWIVEDTAG